MGRVLMTACAVTMATVARLERMLPSAVCLTSGKS